MTRKRTTRNLKAAGIAVVPDHPHGPACVTHSCGVCVDCGGVHHWTRSDVCLRCWIAARWPHTLEVTS